MGFEGKLLCSPKETGKLIFKKVCYGSCQRGKRGQFVLLSLSLTVGLKESKSLLI